MIKSVFQAPNGKYYFKLYDSTGSAIHTSEIIYKTEVEADVASREFVNETLSPEIEVEEPKTSDKPKKPKIEKAKK